MFSPQKGLDIKCTHASQAVRQSAGGRYYRVRVKTKKIIIYVLQHIHLIISFRGNDLNSLLSGQATIKNMQLVSLTGFHWRERGSHLHRPTLHCHLWLWKNKLVWISTVYMLIDVWQGNMKKGLSLHGIPSQSYNNTRLSSRWQLVKLFRPGFTPCETLDLLPACASVLLQSASPYNISISLLCMGCL